MKKNKNFPGPEGQMHEALKGIKVKDLPVQKTEQPEKKVEAKSRNYEDLSTERLLEILKEHSTHVWATEKIVDVLHKMKGKSVTVEQVLKELENYQNENTRGMNLLSKSGLGEEIKIRLEKSDYRQFATEAHKIIEDLKSKIFSAIDQNYDPNKRDIGFAYKIVEQSLNNLGASAGELNNPIVVNKLKILLEGIFGKGKTISNLLLMQMRNKSKVSAEDLKSYVAEMLDYYDGVIFENIANLREDFNALVLAEKKVSVEQSQAKMDNQSFDVKVLPALENFAKKELATSTQKDYLAIWKMLKKQHYDEVLRNGESRQDFVEVLDKGEQKQKEYRGQLIEINDVLSGYISNDGRYSKDRNETIVAWLQGKNLIPPSLRVQARLNESLKGLLDLNARYFGNKVHETLVAFNQEMKKSPADYKDEKAAFDELFKLWLQVRNQKNLEKFSVSDQTAIMGDLLERNWSGLKDKLSALLLMLELGQKQPEKDSAKVAIPKPELKKESTKVAISNPELKKESPAPEKESAPKVEQKDVTEDVLLLLEEMSSRDADTKKVFENLSDQIFLAMNGEVVWEDALEQAILMTKKDALRKAHLVWEDALEKMDNNDRGFFKGLLNRLMDLPDRIVDLVDAFGENVLDDDVLRNLEDNYTKAFSGLFKHLPDKKRLVFDGQVRHRVNQMNALYFNKLFKLLHRDLSNIPSTQLSAIVNTDGTINEEILNDVLAKAPNKNVVNKNEKSE